ncbi:putative WD repeat-containing protein [Phytophthora cinnamomi]|uniref:putative WD repeat-containing protein n=1 Tax=Phytophthora cinnamomi TaxID=4785 RepID=UPI003559D637|nr:putative WD repeat-containing protein [Phytophthora cinnamomi]
MCGVEDTENEGQNSAASSPHSIKGSLAFILDDEDSTGKRSASTAQLDAVEPADVKPKRPSITGHAISSLLTPTNSVDDENEARDATTPTAPLARKGSKYCIVEGCVSRAKHARRCWKHGGSVKCKVAGCRNRAKTKGVCWSHGGGTICSADQCTTIAVSNGVCWAHGGGKRCVTPGCSRPAYERTRNMCSMHYNVGSVASLPAVKRKV